MVLSANDYLRQLQALLPSGPAWTRGDAAVLTALLLSLAQEFGRVDARAADLARELDPRTTVELLPDWERALGLPDACTGPLTSLDERRAAVVVRLCGSSLPPRQYYTRLAALLGYTVTIDTKVDGDPYKWRVNAPEVTWREFTCESPCTEPLRSGGITLLECVIRRRARAHTEVLFAYGA